MTITGDGLVDAVAVATLIGIGVGALRAMVRSIVREEMGETSARLWAICKHLGIEIL